MTRARMMQWIAEGAESGFGTPITGEMCRMLAEDYRLVREANGYALLYTVAPLNPTLSRNTAEIRNGADVCGWCGMAITPSNPHDECQLTLDAFAPVPADQQTWNGGRQRTDADPLEAWTWGPDSENDE